MCVFIVMQREVNQKSCSSVIENMFAWKKATQFIQRAIHAGILKPNQNPFPFSTFYHLANSFEALQHGNCSGSVVILNIPKFRGGPRECGAKNGGRSMGVE